MKQLTIILFLAITTLVSADTIAPSKQLCKIYTDKLVKYEQQERTDNYYKQTRGTYRKLRLAYCKKN